MTIESAIHARLAADATVSGLVGTRIYALRLPQNVVYPAISYHKVSGVRVHELVGAGDLATPRISVNSWAQTYAGAKALANAVRACLNGFSGTVDDGASPPTVLATIGMIRIENEIDLDEDEADLDGVYRVLQDYFASHRET